MISIMNHLDSVMQEKNKSFHANLIKIRRTHNKKLIELKLRGVFCLFVFSLLPKCITNTMVHLRVRF